jgi:BirA family biotin operon repressor/biotin-[acetyl-CoA-carboxylase] ligase
MTPSPPAPQALVELGTTTSTQEHARALLRDGAAHGTIVVARAQTAGRGRRGRAWVSGPHGLWLSLVLRSDAGLPMTRAPRLPLLAADLVVEVLGAHGRDAMVKWPNDILVQDPAATAALGPFRKVGGLLLEAVDVDSVGGAPRLRSAVLGLGLNLRVPTGGFPEEIAATAGALWPDSDGDAHAGDADDAHDARRRALALALGAALARRLPDDADDDDAFAAARARLTARSATLGRRVLVEGVCGTARALDDEGALVVRDDDGVDHVVRAGDVAVLGDGVAAGGERGRRPFAPQAARVGPS